MNLSQIPISFPSDSPINIEKLGGQNKRLYDWLAAGNNIHVFHIAKRNLQIGYLNSRISDLNKAGVTIYKRMITVPDMDGNPTDVKEYSLSPFEKP